MLKKLYPLVLGVLFIAFPFLIHYGLRYIEPSVFAGFLFLLLMIRTLLTPSANKLGKILMSVAVTFYCGAIAFFDSEQLLRYYPVLIGLYIALLFFLSLFDQKSMIEKFAVLSGKTFPDGARLYMRTLTKLWVLLLLVNASISAYSACCTSANFWVLYNGFLSYLVILGFMAGEIVFRQSYRRKHYPEWDSK